MEYLNQVLDKLGYKLNAMQQDVYDTLRHKDKSNVIVLSPTGTGKTLSYLLPIIEQLDTSTTLLECLVVVPGRELAMQSADVLKSMGTDINACACFGGRPAMDEHRIMRKLQPKIIFGTPGRLNDHIAKGNISTEHIRYVVLDEYDKCLELGFRNEMTSLLSTLPAHVGHVFLSATRCKELETGGFTSHYTTLDYLVPKRAMADRIKLYQINSSDKDKLACLLNLLFHLGDQSTIVFMNYRDAVERVANFLKSFGFMPAVYHGGLDQAGREDSLYKFMNGSSNILVCTDLGSRGLDMPDVQNIVNYHLPETLESFIHRVGRTARWNAAGRAFVIVGPEESIPSYVEAEFEPFDLPVAEPQLDPRSRAVPLPKMTTLYIGKGKKNKISKGDVVGFFCKQCGLSSQDIGRIDVYDYYSLVAVDRASAPFVLKKAKGLKIKGIKTIVEEK